MHLHLLNPEENLHSAKFFQFGTLNTFSRRIRNRLRFSGVVLLQHGNHFFALVSHAICLGHPCGHCLCHLKHHVHAQFDHDFTIEYTICALGISFIRFHVCEAEEASKEVTESSRIEHESNMKGITANETAF